MAQTKLDVSVSVGRRFFSVVAEHWQSKRTKAEHFLTGPPVAPSVSMGICGTVRLRWSCKTCDSCNGRVFFHEVEILSCECHPGRKRCEPARSMRASGGVVAQFMVPVRPRGLHSLGALRGGDIYPEFIRAGRFGIEVTATYPHGAGMLP